MGVNVRRSLLFSTLILGFSLVFFTLALLSLCAARLVIMAPSIRSWIVSALTLCAASHTATAHPRVTLRNGTYEGVRHPSFAQDMFLGIPYAQDTGGQNRFYIPQSLNESWTGVRTAHTYGPACPSHQVEADGALGMSEKCLSINIVRPSHIPNNITLPVVLWIHGGSYQVGTSSLPYYNLTYIVERSVQMGKPIVAASINYRKGGWGMLYSVEVQGAGQTNLALRDMRKISRVGEGEIWGPLGRIRTK